MKIKKRTTYKIDLFEEPNIKSAHTRTSNGTLVFTGLDLLNAIISSGMPDTFLSKLAKRKRSDEIKFKTQLFETFIESDKDNKLFFNKKRINYLDSTEIGAINYWLGMILITVLGQKKYNYEFMVHLSKITSFSSIIDVDITTYKTAKGKTMSRSPDLIAINNRAANTYGIFESKGYSKYDKEAMENGFEQAKSVNTINGHRPTDQLVVMTTTMTKRLNMIEKDPKGEGRDILVDLKYMYLYHYLPIVELIMELTPEEQAGYMCGKYEIGEDGYTIKLPLDLYNKFSTIFIGDKEFNPQEFFEGIEISELIKKNQNEDILLVE